MIRQSTHKYHSYMQLQFYEINAMPLGVIGYCNSIYGHNFYKLLMHLSHSTSDVLDEQWNITVFSVPG